MKKLATIILFGVAVKFFLQSPQGRRLKRRMKEWLGKVEDGVNAGLENMTHKIERTAGRVDHLVQKTIGE